jgi:VCBS repeat-containing protein
VTVVVTAKDPDSTTVTLNMPMALHGTFGPMTQVMCLPFGTGKACGAAIVYTPAPNYNGADTITFTATDGVQTSVPVTANLTIVPVNDPPVAVADAATTTEETAVVVPVLANDSDLDTASAALKPLIASQPSHGSAVVNANKTITYTPARNYSGTDSFTYRTSDGSLNSVPVAVTITVTAVNDAPVANNDTAQVTRGGSVTIAVLANDTDADGNTLTLTSVTQGAKGTAAIVGNTVKYTAGAGFTTSDTFTYTISDGKGGTATGRVTVSLRKHGDDDDCDHLNRRNGHRSGDGCEHERDSGRRDGGGDDRDRGNKGN